MKKFAFVVVMLFSVLVVSNIILAQADSEYETALKYYNSKKYQEAVDLLKEYVKKNPTPEAYYRIGYALYKLKRFDEANEYFKEVYLIDPNFILPMPKMPKEHITAETKPPEEKAPVEEKPQVPKTKEVVKPEAKEVKKEAVPEKPVAKVEPAPAKQPVQPVQPQKPEQKKVTPAPTPEPQKVQPPAGMPTFPKPEKGMPAISPEILTGLIAGFGMIMVVIWLALYIYFSLCLFLIAKKLDVSAPWTAWIPIIQIWTFVASAGKPWWWILLLFVPLINAIIGIYLWMCIAENLGKSKWLGLLILVPIVNLIFLGILAFSKSETSVPSSDFPVEEPPAEE